jgi:hypothetical protein
MVLYGAACVCPAVKLANPAPAMARGLVKEWGGRPDNISGPSDLEFSGFEALLTGWHRPLIIPWSANILLLIGWVLLLCRKVNGALLFGIAGVVAGLSTWAFSDYFEQLLVGYYLWQASLIAFAVGALTIRYQVLRSQKETKRTDRQAEPVAADVTMNVKPRLGDDGR